MNTYQEKRTGKRAEKDVIQYFLQLFREDLHNKENEERRRLKNELTKTYNRN